MKICAICGYSRPARWRNWLTQRNPVDNLTCLIQEQETLGNFPIFWKDEVGEPVEAEILPVRRLS